MDWEIDSGPLGMKIHVALGNRAYGAKLTFVLKDPKTGEKRVVEMQVEMIRFDHDGGEHHWLIELTDWQDRRRYQGTYNTKTGKGHVTQTRHES